MSSTPTSSREATSPQQLQMAVQAWMSSIEAIANEHGLLPNESGASYSSYVSRAHSGSSQSAGGTGSSIFSSQQREGSTSTGLTSLSVGSVGSRTSLLSGKLAASSVASGSGSGGASSGQSSSAKASPAPSSSRQAVASSAAGRTRGGTAIAGLSSKNDGSSSSSNNITGFLAANGLGSELSTSPSGTMTKSPLAQAADGEESDSVPSASLAASVTSSSSSQQAKPDSASGKADQVMESPGITSDYDARENIWGEVARKLKPFGDTLRQERLRTTLGGTSLAQDTAKLLYFSAERKEDGPRLHDAQIEMMRVLANMCIDHEGNRDVCLACEAPQACLAGVRHILDSDLHDFPLNLVTLLRMAMGALNNMQLDHAPTREALRSDTASTETLLRLATDARIYKVGDWYRPHDPSLDVWDWKRKVSAGSYVSSSAWQLLQDVCAGDADKDKSPESGPARRSSEDSEDGEKTFDSIVRIGATTAAKYLIVPLEPFAAKAKNRLTTPGPWDADDVADLVESDANAVQSTAELIESCALDAKDFRIAALDDTVLGNGPSSTNSVLEFLLRFLDAGDPPHAWLIDREDSDSLPPKPSDEEVAKESLSAFTRAKGAIARAIILIVAEDDNMATLFEGKAGDGSDSAKQSWFIETMKEWMARDSKARDDLVSTAMLAIGNLARKDSHCIALVHEHGLVPSLTAALQADADIKVAHAIVCLLKNLSIPPRNKAPIGQSNQIFARIEPFIGQSTDRVQPLQFAAVGLLKHLCTNCLSNALTLTTKSNCLNGLLELLKRTEDVPTRMEGTRALVTTIKSLWSSPAPLRSDDPEAATSTFAKSITDLGVRSVARRKLITEPVVMALADMIRGSTKYPVLVNEGILALTLLATDTDTATNSAQLVARCLLHNGGLNKKRSRTGADVADEAAQELMASAQANDNKELASSASSNAPQASEDLVDDAKSMQPRRQTTLESLASSGGAGLPPIRSGADMVATVLARRDARMPPHFASNACALVQTLISTRDAAEPETAKPRDAEDDDANVADTVMSDLDKAAVAPAKQDYVVIAVRQWLPALKQLSEIGPQESVGMAQQALQSADAVLKSSF